MTDFTMSAFDTPAMVAKKHRPTFGQRLILWIETSQQRRADRKIDQMLRRR